VAEALKLTGIHAHYARAHILHGINLEVAEGEAVALMGRNGAGKSTTLKTIIGLVQASDGNVAFEGRDITRTPTHRIISAGIGYVPEDRRIFTDLTVFENIEVGRQAPGDGVAPWTPERLFEFFPNLAEMKNRRANQMSGGEQQMLTVARTLMGNPRMILLDEPSEGLAPVIVEQMAAAILKLKAEGIAVLLSEQNLFFAAAVCDRCSSSQPQSATAATSSNPATSAMRARSAICSTMKRSAGPI